MHTEVVLGDDFTLELAAGWEVDLEHDASEFPGGKGKCGFDVEEVNGNRLDAQLVLIRDFEKLG